MAELAQALGVGPEFVYEGKAYRLKPLTLVHYAMFESWLERQAWEALKRARPTLSAQEHEDALSRVTKDIASGAYGYGGDAFAKAVHSLAGMKRLALLSLRDEHPEVGEEFVDRLFEHQLSEITRLMVESNP